MGNPIHCAGIDSPGRSVTATYEIDGLPLVESQICDEAGTAINLIEMIRLVAENHRAVALRVYGILRVAHRTIWSRVHQGSSSGRVVAVIHHRDSHLLLLLLLYQAFQSFQSIQHPVSYFILLCHLLLQVGYLSSQGINSPFRIIILAVFQLLELCLERINLFG